MNGWRIGALWLVALVLTTGVTWQIVSLAGGQIGDRPLTVLADENTAVTGSETSTTTTHSPTTSTTSVTSTTTTSDSTTSTTGTSQPTSPTSSVTTAAAAEWSVKTVNTAGGTVVIRFRPGEVELLSAVAAAGYEVEVDDRGPPRVRIEFESASDDIRIEARWRDGLLEITED